MNESDILSILKTVPNVKFEMAKKDDIIFHFKMSNGVIAISDIFSTTASPEAECCGISACVGTCEV